MDVSTLTTIGRVALALTFGAAAVSKLADRDGVAAAAAALGVPSGLARPVAGLLPVVELAVAAALLWRPSAAAGAGAGLFLLALFTCLVILNLRRGRRPPCRCFGQVGSAPIGAGTVGRNVALMVLAAAVLLAA
ncbi:MAG: hypothetical protein QOE93_1602 [Actinomycetota bacterium]|nr:hypothetical protein [Actinomycetota bacterium]